MSDRWVGIPDGTDFKISSKYDFSLGHQEVQFAVIDGNGNIDIKVSEEELEKYKGGVKHCSEIPLYLFLEEILKLRKENEMLRKIHEHNI